MFKSIEDLARDRKVWIDVSRRNNFEKGIKRLLTELYPDNAHFIYELLQNAEDTKASEVRFILSNDKIAFEHNGDRLFDLRDIESITSIGESTKSDDPTNIGKFGVGFKAVFAYTSTPEIHSGEFHFCIHDLVVPELNSVEALPLGLKETRFIFPFNHPTKRPSQAVEEIERGLLALGNNTLLFLTHIRRIEYVFPDGTSGSLSRIDHKKGHIEIQAHHSGGENSVSHWLRYRKNVEVTDEDGADRKCRIAIAYSIVEEENNKKKRQAWKIKPVERGQVSIYFPAEKEVSNLRFHIHAPFASTVARDSVRDCDSNRQLRNHIALLITESLVNIRDRRMLTMNFLAVLPNETDNLPRFYEPIRQKIIQIFKDQELTPTKSGRHAPSTKLYRGPAKIAEVLNDEDLSFLTSFAPPLWVANPPQLGQREDRFLDSLEITKFAWSELIETLSLPHHFMWADKAKVENATHIQRIQGWVKEKNDAWLMRFYALMGEASGQSLKTIKMNNIRIVRVQSDENHDHVLPQDAFFAPKQGANPLNDVRFVKSTVYRTGRSESLKKHASFFLEGVGVRPYDEKAVIELKLQNYGNSAVKNDDAVHVIDVNQFFTYWKKNPADVNIFKNHDFLLGVSDSGELCWCNPSSLCLDIPFKETGLGALTKIHNRYVVWGGYSQELNHLKIKDFISFLSAIGIMQNLKIECVSTNKNPHEADLKIDLIKYGTRPTNTGVDEDYTIFDIEHYLSEKSIPASRLIWNTLIHADSKVATASFRPNKKYPTRGGDSQLVCFLQNYVWIPNKAGAFQKPENMTKDELRDDFPFDNSNGLLSAILFGEKARLLKSEYQQLNRYAKEIGFESVDEAEKMAQLVKLIKDSGESTDIFIEKIRSKSEGNKPIFPSRPVTDQDRRQERISEQLFDALDKEYEVRDRSVRTTSTAIEPIIWLRNLYTNENGQMICQICKEEHFRKRNGEHYFEKKELFSRKYLPKEHEAQYLALCPLCAAKYEEFVKTDDNVMTKLKEEIINGEVCETPISLGNEKTNIRFVSAHHLDLKVILNFQGEEGEEVK